MLILGVAVSRRARGDSAGGRFIAHYLAPATVIIVAILNEIAAVVCTPLGEDLSPMLYRHGIGAGSAPWRRGVASALHTSVELSSVELSGVELSGFELQSWCCRVATDKARVTAALDQPGKHLVFVRATTDPAS